MRLKDRIRTSFNNLSLYKKIIWILFGCLACTYAVFFLNIRFLTRRYEQELYRTNAHALDHVSSAISSKMQTIETISYDILNDSTIQDYLVLLNEQPDTDRSAVYRRNVYNALYSYIFFNDYIKSIAILLEDGTSICMGSSVYIQQFDTALLEKTADAQKGRSVWSAALNAGTDAACVRQIRQLRYLNLEKLATLYLIVDMDAIVQDSLISAGYPPEESEFLLLSQNQQIYPKDSDYEAWIEPIENRMERGQNLYTICSILGKKKFIISGSISEVDWDYLYLRDYDSIFSSIRQVKLLVTLFSACFAALTLFLITLMFRRILIHLDFLIQKIQRFGNGEMLLAEPEDYDYASRYDEIGKLHCSFDQMTKSVKMLRDENYDKQLLLRDAAIKMLKQQINPHFLYNTLDTINWMAQMHGEEDISLMVRSLAKVFRASITAQDDLILLSEELENLNNYIQIQKIRFKDRLNFHLDIPEDISRIYIPTFCIQPLVENALKYAMEYSDETCSIYVTITQSGEQYLLSVANTGSSFEEDMLWKLEHNQLKPHGSGVGLANIYSRLKLLYGDRGIMQFENKDGMAVITLSIPIKKEDSNAETDDCR